MIARSPLEAFGSRPVTAAYAVGRELLDAGVNVVSLDSSPGYDVQGQWEGLIVHRPRFFCFPGVLKTLDGGLYARGLRRWAAGLCPRWRPDVLDAHFVWPDGRLIVTVAHLGHRKGNRETIRALGDLPSDVRLVLVGGDPDGRKNVQAIRALAAELALGDRVIVTGRQPYEKVPLYFNAADVTVLASYREGCPNVVLESLASGTPVVASDVGAVPEMLSCPAAGRMVPPRRVEPLARALAEVLEAPPPPQDVANVNAVKSWDDVAKEVLEVLSCGVNLCWLSESK